MKNILTNVTKKEDHVFAGIVWKNNFQHNILK